MNTGIHIGDVLGGIVAVGSLAFMAYKGISCVLNPAKEREKFLNSRSFISRAARSRWAPVWWIRAGGIIICSLISLIIIAVALKTLGVFH